MRATVLFFYYVFAKKNIWRAKSDLVRVTFWPKGPTLGIAVVEEVMK